MNAPSPALCHLQFPGESAEYRPRETHCSRRKWRCGGRSSASPPNAALCQPAARSLRTIEFEGDDGPVKLSELFASGKDTLAIYSFMYGPERERACPGCTHFLDALDGEVEHIVQRVNLAVVAKSPFHASLRLREGTRLAPAASAVHRRQQL